MSSPLNKKLNLSAGIPCVFYGLLMLVLSTLAVAMFPEASGMMLLLAIGGVATGYILRRECERL